MNLFKITLFAFFIWGAVTGAKPYWERFWVEKDVEVAAVYGTKNSVAETRRFLDKKMKMEGRIFRGDDFVIKKDRDNNVVISISYIDELRLFGYTLKELHFEVVEKAEEVTSHY